jgi:glycosyltransferase involved in cell wall biosynthesis
MNVLFLTLCDIRTLDTSGIYEDLLREFTHQGHQVYVVSPSERRTGGKTGMLSGNDHILKVKTGNTTQTNLIEKGISTILIESQFKAAIKKHLSHVKFDLILYSTPPITLAGAIQYVKNRDGAKTYLLLKDIFPQNAVDIGMMAKTGPKAALYHFFRQKEKQLYTLSDWIGCMSPANVRFLLRNNPQISADKVEVCPNSIDPQDMRLNADERTEMRQKYSIPVDKKVFVYGGNLGKPQGIPFLIDCLKSQHQNEDAFFLIVGSGTEYDLLEHYVTESAQANVKLMRQLPKEDYDRMIAACDVGMIFLDHRFTIPNFPSRLLSYMQAQLPVLACTDPNTDIGEIITEGGFGWWCRSDDVTGFCQSVEEAMRSDLPEMGRRGADYMEKNYHVRSGYDIIVSHLDM